MLYSLQSDLCTPRITGKVPCHGPPCQSPNTLLCRQWASRQSSRSCICSWRSICSLWGTEHSYQALQDLRKERTQTQIWSKGQPSTHCNTRWRQKLKTTRREGKKVQGKDAPVERFTHHRCLSLLIFKRRKSATPLNNPPLTWSIFGPCWYHLQVFPNCPLESFTASLWTFSWQKINWDIVYISPFKITASSLKDTTLNLTFRHKAF